MAGIVTVQACFTQIRYIMHVYEPYACMHVYYVMHIYSTIHMVAAAVMCTAYTPSCSQRWQWHVTMLRILKQMCHMQ